jgi:cyclopropane fatty-acyl-phospholipid synthase-like methyltransferase
MENYTDRDYWEKYYNQATVDRRIIEGICSKYEFFWNKLFRKGATGKESLLEIGAYPGRYLAYLAHHYQVEPFGLDFNQDKTKVIATMNLFGVEKFDYIQEDFFRYSPSHKFDVVYSNGFIEHFDKFDEVLDKHVQWTKDGGYVMVMIPNKRYLRYWYGMLCDYNNLKAHNLKCMNLNVFRDFAQRNGLVIDHLDYFGAFAFKVHQPLNFFQKLIYKIVRATVKATTPWMERNPGKYYSSTIIGIFRKPK